MALLAHLWGCWRITKHRSKSTPRRPPSPEQRRGARLCVGESGAFDAHIQYDVASDAEDASQKAAKRVAHYESGTGFGELALQEEEPRTETT